MNLTGLIAKKNGQTQAFLEDGTRIPVSLLSASGNVVTQIKNQDKDGYISLQLGFKSKKKANKAEQGHGKKAGTEKTPRFLKELRFSDLPDTEVGAKIEVSEIFKPGDIVDVIGVSKGKGFAGGVKLHHFKGGPRTHGQSDRERAPGSIGQTTTPGRVYKGKRMASRMGHERVTVKNLQVIDVTSDGVLLIKGLVPGGVNNILMVRKVGEVKKFVPLYKEETKETEGAVEVKDEALESPQQLEESSKSEETEETKETEGTEIQEKEEEGKDK